MVRGKSKRKRKKDRSKLWVSLASIFGIVFLEYQAMIHGIDGSMLALSFAIIGGIAGAKISSLVRRFFK